MLRKTWRLIAVAALCVCFVPTSAAAHVQGAAEVIAPKQGAWVRTPTTTIEIMGRGNARSSFFVEVDGQAVDGKGRRGTAVFIPFALEPGKILALSVPLAKGGHEVRVRHVTDPDFPVADSVSRFSVGDPVSPGRAYARWLVPLLALLTVGGVIALRVSRRRAADAAKRAKPAKPPRPHARTPAGGTGRGKG
jgi:hypothetical protein